MAYFRVWPISLRAGQRNYIDQYFFVYKNNQIIIDAQIEFARERLRGNAVRTSAQLPGNKFDCNAGGRRERMAINTASARLGGGYYKNGDDRDPGSYR